MVIEEKPHFRVLVKDFSSLKLQLDITQTRWLLPNNILPEPTSSTLEQMAVDVDDDTCVGPYVPFSHSTPPTAWVSPSVPRVDTTRYIYTRWKT